MEWNMDNDNEIRRSINRSIDNFLDRESQNLPKENAGVQYDMQKAYMATKSNFWKRTAPVLIWMIGAVLGVVLITGAIVMIVNRQNSRISVEVQSFDDLNLRNLLDLVGSTQRQIDDESNNKRILEIKRKQIANTAESERDSALETLASLNIRSASEKKKRTDDIEAEYQKAMEEAYLLDEQIAESERKIELYQQQLAQYDTVTVEQARQQQAQLDSEKQLHELEKKELTANYESQISDLRKNFKEEQDAALVRQQEMVDYVIGQYDPSFEDDTMAQSIVRKSVEYDETYIGTEDALNEKASDEFKAALEKQTQYFTELSSMRNRFGRLPQKNAIPRFASALERIANTAGNDLAKASVTEINALILKNEELASLNETLTGEKEAMTTQLEGLVSEHDSLVAERDSIASERDSLQAERDGLVASNDALVLEKGELSSINESLATERNAIAAEKDALAAQVAGWASERDTLIQERNALASEKAALVAERDRLASQNVTLAAERDSMQSQYDSITEERKVLSDEMSAFDSEKSTLEKERDALASANDSLTAKNESLSNQNAQYTALLQALCTRSDSPMQALVLKVRSPKKVQLYVEKSVLKSMTAKVKEGLLVPVIAVQGGKLVALGKLSIEGGNAYMVPGDGDEELILESLVTMDALNPYTSLSAGDEIRFGEPM